METSLSTEQAKLYELILKANKEQTQEIKTEIQENIKSLNRKLEKSIEEVEYWKRRSINLERKIRRNNVIVFGLKNEDEASIVNITIQRLNELLETDIRETDINNIYTIGKTENSPVVIEFISYLRKNTLFANKDKLKTLKDNRISIAHDLCQEDREEQKILLKHRKIALDQKEDAKIEGRTLYVNNKPYTTEELRKIDLENACEESSTETEEEEEGEIQPSQERTLRNHKNITEKVQKVQPVAAASHAQQAQKRKTGKTYKYSPKHDSKTRKH
ncbi:unnamed protein product [Phaedon cochleariae]|uniref:Endonuclease-reverse transcriptase n=1 Tax=Phaedon cochleariae TaxID=80249 RepID=A0A9N9X2W8_PHACE|nr:unnamed protein product [Phaedon cochleariae]